MMFRRKQPSLLPKTTPIRTRRRSHMTTMNHRPRGTLTMWMVPGFLLLLIACIHWFALDGSGSHRPRRSRELTVDTPYFDVIVLGSGPAGMTAALYAVRGGWSTLLVGSIHESQLARALTLDNLPGRDGNGLQWLQATQNQLLQFHENIHTDNHHKKLQVAQPTLQASRVTRASGPDESLWQVQFDDNQQVSVSGLAVVIATGSTPRPLELPHEKALWGKQIHSCAICDGSLYRDQTVVVVGGGDAAVDAALYLSRVAKQVIVVHRRVDFRATNKRNSMQLEQTSNIQVKTPFVVDAYEVQKDRLVAVKVRHSDSTDADLERIPCDGVFLLLGSTPNTKFLESSYTNADGSIRPVDGLLAAGDVVDQHYRQAVTAASMGAQVILDVEEYLRDNATPQHAIPDNVPLVTNTVKKVPTTIQRKVASEQLSDNQTLAYDCDLTITTCITKIISENAVVVFSKPWCPFCRKALAAMDEEGVKPLVIDLTMSNARDIQATLASLSGGRRTVPNVFIGGKSIGGGDETVALHRTGELRTLLAEAKAL